MGFASNMCEATLGKRTRLKMLTMIHEMLSMIHEKYELKTYIIK